MPDTQTTDNLRADHARRFWEIARSEEYNDTPCKIETDANGKVVKEPPPTFGHKWNQKRIEQLLDRAMDGGEAATEFPVHTREGTKLPDVAWVSYDGWKEAVADDLSLPVPRICVEVISPSNTKEEMSEKRRLYLEIGVEEVWMCDPDGTLQFYDENGQIETSRLVQGAPERISMDIGP